MFKIGDILINLNNVGKYFDGTTYEIVNIDTVFDTNDNDKYDYFHYMDLVPMIDGDVLYPMYGVEMNDKKWILKIDYDRRKKLEKLCLKLGI